MRTHRFPSAQLSAFLASLALVAGCNFYYEKPEGLGLDSGSLSDGNSAVPSWDQVNHRLFTPKCVSCHHEFRSCDGVVAALSEIRKRVVFERSMPPSKALKQSEISLLDRWIAAGAPEFPPPVPGASPSPTPSPSPSSLPSPSSSLTPPPTVEEPVLPTFASIKERIFVPRCLRCHSPEGSAKKVPLSTAADLLDSPSDLVLPGNAAESGLMLVITRDDKKRMPPPKTGPALSPQEIEAIRTWIDKGAKD